MYDEVTKNGYECIKNMYPSIKFYEVDTRKNNIKEILETVLKNITSCFTILSTDKMIITRTISIENCIKAMQKTHAYAFHFRLGRDIRQIFPLNVEIEIPHLITVSPNIFAWNFQYADADWAYASNLDFTLYRTDELQKTFNKLIFHDLDSLEIQWANTTDIDRVGLCCEHASAKKVYWKNNQDILYTPAQLSYLFGQGFAINIKKLSSLSTTSRIEWVANFIRQ